MTYIHITSEQESQRLADDLSGVRRFALDCEAAGFHRYSDRLCLLQVTTPTATYIVDPLAFDVSDLFRSVLEDPEIEVVMHGADYDLRLLHRDLGISLRGLFDTQIAASLLGLDALGLAAQLAERFDVKLTKKYQRADWAERPLTEGMLDYAASDTRYLLELGDQMLAEMESAGRAEWASQECRALEVAAVAPKEETEPVDPVTRVKGARDLEPRQVHAIRVAIGWRDEIAKLRDRATFRVVGDPPLIEAVALAPRRAEELIGIKGFPGGLARNEGKELLRRLRAVAELTDEEIVPYPRRRGGPGRPPPEIEELADRLKVIRNRRADELGLARGSLMSNALLLEIARVGPTSQEELRAVDGIRPWKADSLGDELLGVISAG
jgi:ribonuclease D